MSRHLAVQRMGDWRERRWLTHRGIGMPYRLRVVIDADGAANNDKISNDNEEEATQADRELQAADALLADDQDAPGAHARPLSYSYENADLTSRWLTFADPAMRRRLLLNGLLILAWFTTSMTLSMYNKMLFGRDHMDVSYP
ncbi:hypothetical protein EV182_007640, partial [Spiromyces aspiralis]